jgi:hypothetical protein
VQEGFNVFGPKEGNDEGITEGLLVGSAVGYTVGLTVGVVGLKDGLLVGKKVGLRETGMDDGFLVVDGNRVGSTEGEQDGSTVG